jgi:hypothetical protein
MRLVAGPAHQRFLGKQQQIQDVVDPGAYQKLRRNGYPFTALVGKENELRLALVDGLRALENEEPRQWGYGKRYRGQNQNALEKGH